MKRYRELCALAAALLLRDRGVCAITETVKIGVLNDMSGLYADLGGPGSVAAAKMAVEDSAPGHPRA